MVLPIPYVPARKWGDLPFMLPKTVPVGPCARGATVRRLACRDVPYRVGAAARTRPRVGLGTREVPGTAHGAACPHYSRAAT